jgi:hypothetical protein
MAWLIRTTNWETIVVPGTIFKHYRDKKNTEYIIIYMYGTHSPSVTRTGEPKSIKQRHAWSVSRLFFVRIFLILCFLLATKSSVTLKHNNSSALKNEVQRAATHNTAATTKACNPSLVSFSCSKFLKLNLKKSRYENLSAPCFSLRVSTTTTTTTATYYQYQCLA